MSQPELFLKLERLLTSGPFTSEAQVIYFLVETQKLLDRDSNKKYRLMKFYRDWSVHTNKDRITPEIRRIIGDIYQELLRGSPSHAISGKADAFIGMDELGNEIALFLKEYNLPL